MPIEIDAKLTIDEKIPYMIEWWTKSQSLTASLDIYRDNIVEIVKNSNSYVRDGCYWFFYTLERHEIPLLIFSAGIGNIVEEVIAQQCGKFKNMKFVSNFMVFSNPNNKLLGFQGKLIHVFNKNESVLLDTEYERAIQSRTNVILIGDSTGDSNMADGLENIKNELKIGFLNENIDQLLDIYEELFDIVIVNDNTFEVPNAILRNII